MKKMPKGVKLKIFLTVTALLTIVMLVITATFAWFSYNTRGAVERFWMKPIVMPDFLISDQDNGWNESIHISVPPGELKPVCGSAFERKFYYPTFSLEESTQEDRPDLGEHATATYSTLTKVTLHSIANNKLGDYVFTYNATLHSQSPCYVRISPSSGFGPPPKVQEGSLDHDFFSHQPTDVFGSYGAVRIALYVWDSSLAVPGYRVKCVWVPNAHFEYFPGNYSFITNGEIESGYASFSGSDYDNDRIDIPTSDEGYAIDDNDVIWIWDLEKAPPVFRMTEGDLRIQLVVWIDGTDRECVNVLSGGNATLFMKFTAVYN